MIAFLGIMKSVGPKLITIAAVVLVAYLAVNYIQDKARNEYIKDIRIEQIQKELDVKEKVDELLEQNRKNNPTRDGSVALDRLREQYGREQGGN